jgi:DNA-binding transcriptional regulator YhcF (GntR family)
MIDDTTNKTFQKTEISGIVKAGEGVLLNTDNESLNSYKLRKEKEKKLKRFELDLNSLKSDMEEIKNLLKGLVK